MIKETYSGEAIDELIKFFKLEIDGILHVGAHRCEELNVYLKYIDIKNIVWVEALKFLVDENLKKNTDLIIINEVVYNSFVWVTLGCFGISTFEKVKK